MAQYLRKYVGTYRVKADYDLETKDFPRDEHGSLDSSFDDLYIECKNNIKIRHGVGNILSCYIPSKSRGLNVLRQIYQDKISDKLPKETGYFEKLCAELVEKEILVSAEVLDFEVYFEFKAVEIDYIAKLVGAKTNGKSISPFSTKNLPKAKIKIPDEEIAKYKEIISSMDKNNLFAIRNITTKFLTDVLEPKFKKKNPDFDYKIDIKQLMLSRQTKEYVWEKGMWDDYLAYFKKEIDKLHGD